MQKRKQPTLKLSFLGGVGEVGKNMLAVEYGDEMIIVDAGVAFPSDDMPGIDLIIPDFNYIQVNKHRIKAVILTHGHEDHIGAMPYLMKHIDAPVYATKLTAALVDSKLREHRNVRFKINVIKPKDTIKAGVFSIEFIKVTHSISGAVALAVTTPAGVWFHTGDFKLDLTPIDGEPTDLVRLGEISKKGVLLLTADSTNASRPGFSMSERKVGQTLDTLFAQNKPKRIIIATFASNVHRIQQIFDLCAKHDRKVLLTGRSMIRVCEIAHKVGELKYDKSILADISKVDKYDDEKICILSTGTQGEQNSALSRMAAGEFRKIKINQNDCIIFSASAIPGNEFEINTVINELFKKGANVIYESLAEVHVSGHAYQEELKLILNILKPKFYMPCHGEYRHLMSNAKLAMDLGMAQRHIHIPELGESISVTPNSIKKTGTVPSGVKVIDGHDISDAGGSVQRERLMLATEGLCVVLLTLSARSAVLTSKPEIITRGFLYGKTNHNSIEEAKNLLINTIINVNFKNQDWNIIKESIKRTLTSFFFKKFKRKPMIITIIVETN